MLPLMLYSHLSKNALQSAVSIVSQHNLLDSSTYPCDGDVSPLTVVLQVAVSVIDADENILRHAGLSTYIAKFWKNYVQYSF